MGTKMSDILDAYSIHVFWDYFDTQKLVDRLTEVRAIVNALPVAGRKPLYVSEYGIRGLRTFNGAPAGDPGVWDDGTPMARTNINAFQHAWFDVLAADLGYVGTSKWDSYFGKYDNGTQAYYMIGSPADGWPLYPIYNSMRLFTSTVGAGWRHGERRVGPEHVAAACGLRRQSRRAHRHRPRHRRGPAEHRVTHVVVLHDRRPATGEELPAHDLEPGR